MIKVIATTKHIKYNHQNKEADDADENADDDADDDTDDDADYDDEHFPHFISILAQAARTNSPLLHPSPCP